MSLRAGMGATPGRAVTAGRVLALMAAGALNTLAFAPLSWWWLQPASALLLFLAVARAHPGRAALYGAAFGVGWLGSGWWWLHISLHQYGGLAWGLAAAAVALLALAMSLYLAAAMALAAWARTGRPVVDAAVVASAWLAAELARAEFFTGFPWSASGYAHTVGPLAALAPWVGVYGIGVMSAGFMALAAQALRRPRAHEARPGPAGRGGQGRWGLAVSAGLLASLVLAAHALPADFTRPTGELRASLLQPSIAQNLKFDAERMGRNLEHLIEQLHAAPGPLVVTPESVVPLPLSVLDPATWERVRQPFLQGDRAALVGIFLGNDEQGYVNSMVGLSAQASPSPQQHYAYGKRHLLPFGEFIPPGFGWFVRLLDIPLGDQARGDHARPFETQGQRLRPLICYEDLFAEELVESVIGPSPATVFVNASNLAWFGRHLVQDQHLQFSQMRALEFQRPFLRSTNTGATAAIDHRGRVLARQPALQPGRLEVVVQGRIGETPYARWLGLAGHVPLWLLAGLGLAVSLGLRRRAQPALAVEPARPDGPGR